MYRKQTVWWTCKHTLHFHYLFWSIPYSSSIGMVYFIQLLSIVVNQSLWFTTRSFYILQRCLANQNGMYHIIMGSYKRVSILKYPWIHLLVLFPLHSHVFFFFFYCFIFWKLSYNWDLKKIQAFFHGLLHLTNAIDILSWPEISYTLKYWVIVHGMNTTQIYTISFQRESSLF